MNVLGISIGTLHTGIGILSDGELVEWQSHLYPKQWSNYKLQLIINRYKRYIIEYKVTSVIVKTPPLKNYTKELKQILSKTEQLAIKYNCTFNTISKYDIKNATGVRNTSQLIEYATNLYPALTDVFMKGTPTKHRYYKKLYEAILGARLHYESIKSNN